MGRYVLRRLIVLIPTLFGMSLLIFLMLRLLPGDVVDVILGGSDQQVDNAAKQALRKSLGLADPLPVQYARWIGGLFRGDLGTSLRSGEAVRTTLTRALPITLELA